jgi:hypothetical protein
MKADVEKRLTDMEAKRTKIKELVAQGKSQRKGRDGRLAN